MKTVTKLTLAIVLATAAHLAGHPVLAASVLVIAFARAVYRITPSGRRARLARIDSLLAALEGELESYDFEASESRIALGRFLDSFPGKQVPASDLKASRTVQDYRYTIADAELRAGEIRAKTKKLAAEKDRLRLALTQSANPILDH